MAKINTRSPYYISLTATNLIQVDFDIWIYTGTKITDRTTGSLFRLSSVAITNTVTVEIAELVSDYILSTFDGDYDCTNVWVDYRSLSTTTSGAGSYTGFTTLGGFNGYGFFEDGANPQNLQSLLQSSITHGWAGAIRMRLASTATVGGLGSCGNAARTTGSNGWSTTLISLPCPADRLARRSYQVASEGRVSVNVTGASNFSFDLYSCGPSSLIRSCGLRCRAIRST